MEGLQKFQELLDKFLSEEITPAELKEFLSLSRDSGNLDLLYRVIGEKLEEKAFVGLSDRAVFDEMFQQMLLKAEKIKEDRIFARPVRKIRFLRPVWVRYAAVFIFILGLGYYFQLPEMQNTHVLTSVESADVLPGRNGAVLILAGNRPIVLDSLEEGVIAVQGNSRVVLDDDGLAYIADYNFSPVVTYNTLMTPNGRQFHMKLPDGTAVWLNAGSSITYPTSFPGKEREVTITGEAYLEVAKNEQKPFKVKVNERTEIEVLGTQFNINSYPDEPATKITLFEGSVKVSSIGKDKSTMLSPGQQAQVAVEAISVRDEVDLNEIIAWKNGQFYFKGDDLETIMRQVEKWYDVEVKFESEINHSFVAKISRDVNLSSLLKILELTDLVHFEIQDNTIIVKKGDQ